MNYEPMPMKYGRYEGSITSLRCTNVYSPSMIGSELESIFTWGNNGGGQLGIGSEGEVEQDPYKFKSGGVLALAAGGSNSNVAGTGFLQMDCDAHFSYMYGGLKMAAWGDNTYNQICEQMDNPAFEDGLWDGDNYWWVSVGCMGEHAACIKADGSLIIWGRNTYNQCGVGGSVIYINEWVHDGPWLMVSAGRDFTIGIKQDGTMWGIGRNDTGQLGMAEPTQVDEFTQIGEKDDWTFVSCGSNHSLALDSIGRLYVTGLNDDGQLGLGHYLTRTEFVQQGNMLWKTVSAGHKFSLGYNIERKLQGWGNNLYGQLGIDTSGLNHPNPTDSIITNTWTAYDDQRTIKKVACGGYHSIITTEREEFNGEENCPAFVTGRNNNNQLGMGEGSVGGTDLNVFTFPEGLEGEQEDMDQGYSDSWFWVDCGAEHTALTYGDNLRAQQLTGNNRSWQCKPYPYEENEITTRGTWVSGMHYGAQYFSFGLGLNFSIFLRSAGT